MKRTLHHLFLSACLGVLAPAFVAAQEAEDRPRSVLFYLMDTCRQDRLGIGGYERDTTPFLEWLSERSVVFEACYSQAPWTKPSMASMLTSQYPSTTGVYRMEQRLPDRFVTWPEVLGQNGYFTAGFSTNIVMGNSLSNFAQGFEHFVEGTYINQGDAIRFASGSAQKLNRHAFSWLDETDHWPMLLYLHSVDPHEEYEPAQEYLEEFADPARHSSFRREWQTLLKSRPPIPGLYVTQDNFDQTEVDASSFIEHASNLYDADILANDDQLQVLWDKLKEDGWADDFVFVFTSDHGEEFFEHGATSHGYSLYDEMIRVPFMIYAPGLLPEGKRIATPVRSLDIYPTLCELLGIEPPEGLAGESLVPLIRGQETERPEVISEHREEPMLRAMGMGSGVMTSLRSGKWKFILNQTDSQLLSRPKYELYDLEADPGEHVNVAKDHPDVVRRFEGKVLAFVTDQGKQVTEAAGGIEDAETLAQLRALGYVGDEEDETDIWVALASKDHRRIKFALREGASPNQMEPEAGIRPLAIAALHGDLNLATILVEAGAKVNLPNRDGSTPLSGAAFLGRPEMVEWLLSRGADPSLKSLTGDTALGATQVPWEFTQYIAKLLDVPIEKESLERGRLRCAEILEQHDARPNDPSARLLLAVREGDLAAVNEALADGARTDQRDPKDGLTALSIAAGTGRSDLVLLLLEQSARVGDTNVDGGTPLHLAAVMGHVDCVEILIDHDADVNARDGQGSTPLHSAAFLGRVEAAEALLDAGAKRGVKNRDGLTPLGVTAVDWGITELVLRLLGLKVERKVVEKGRGLVAEMLRG